MPRLRILNTTEREVYDKPPVLSAAERRRAFDLPASLREAIEQQPSRIELAHHFTRDVAVGNPREFEQTDKDSQEVAESCNRLIKNAIVCWNYLYFEHRLRALADPAEKQALIDTVGRHAMLSWRHVNMLGEYDFSDERLRDSFGLRPRNPAA